MHYLLDKPVYYLDAPDLFYVDLLKELDLPQLAKLAAPTKIVQENFLKVHE